MKVNTHKPRSNGLQNGCVCNLMDESLSCMGLMVQDNYESRDCDHREEEWMGWNSRILSFAFISIDISKILLEVFARSFGCDLLKNIIHL